ncbi:DMT family transporter [Rasiella rasia]|uniref:DMT family transporter n=1 Tax=Rasiella rasia TaxID=2744027 RepID=A0A6G6GSL3_9FLAO|nr:DMT family transporter [Rasiella rasia]QIE60701.1 DMT family transporter [Rasiella rasia]
MMYLLLSVLASTLIFVVFKLFSIFKVNTLHAIVVNYFVACVSGIIAFNGTITLATIPAYNWFFYAIALGSLFIIVFNLMAITTQRSGLSVVSVATKMSVVIPIIFGLLYYKDSLGIYKGVGILLALVAVYLASVKQKDGLAIQPKNLIFPILVFLGSGIIDTSIKYIEGSFVAENDVPIFSATIFASAFSIGILVVIAQAIRGKFRFEFKNIIGGIVLGVPNYFSIYFLVKALRSDLLESSGIFTINNVGIVMLSTLVGIALFKEKLLLKNWIGILVAVLSIFLVALDKLL